MIRVLLVDDQPLIRSGFRALLDVEDDIEVVAEGGEGVALAREHLPDVALVDIQMPTVDGIEATRRIAADPELASVHVVILTNYGLDEYVFDALRAGGRVPRQGRRARRLPPRRAGRSTRRRAAGALDHPRADRPVRHAAAARWGGHGAGGTDQPRA